MTKALREAKRNTSWRDPQVEHEEAVRAFVAAILAPGPDNAFPGDFARFVAPVVRAGLLTSLGQTLLKVAAPGVPDFYQGTELWDLSLVDPDNRRPVDYGRRRDLLLALGARADEGLARRLLAAPADGAIKLYVTSRALRLRRARRELFAAGDYLPVGTEGAAAERVCAFARRLGGEAALAVAARFFLRGGEAGLGDTLLVLGEELGGGPWRDALTGRAFAAERRGRGFALRAGALLEPLPAALLVKEAGGALPRGTTRHGTAGHAGGRRDSLGS